MENPGAERGAGKGTKYGNATYLTFLRRRERGKDGPLQQRAKRFALDVITLVQTLPRSAISDIIGRQLLRSATSVSANYRAACRGRSLAEFIAKMGVAEEDADESVCWLELLIETNRNANRRLAALQHEAEELTAMIVASIRTAKNKR